MAQRRGNPRSAARRSPGFYERRVFPWLNDRLANGPELDRLRGEALATATGQVLEIGFGSGASLPHYGPAVRRLVALDPNPGMHALAAPRLRAARIGVVGLVGEAEHLPLADGSLDTVVSMLTLCTVADPLAVLAEVNRVLRAEGRLILIEHGLALDPDVARWQRRLNRIQNVVACGCNLNRPIAELVEAAGFAWTDLRRFYARGIPRTHGWITMGVAAVRPLP